MSSVIASPHRFYGGPDEDLRVWDQRKGGFCRGQRCYECDWHSNPYLAYWPNVQADLHARSTGHQDVGACNATRWPAL